MAVSKQYQRIVPFILFILALYLLFKLAQPVVTVLLTSILLAYIAYPLYVKFRKRLTYKSPSIILALLIVVLIILIPVAFLAFEVTQQGYIFYNSLSTNIAKGALFGYGCTSAESHVCSIVNQAEKFSVERLSVFGFDKQLQKLLPIVEENVTLFILSIPLIIAQIFFTLVISFFILKEWKLILKKITNLLPMRKQTINALINQFGNIAYTVIYAQLFVALVQGIIGTIGFWIFGVPLPILMGMILAFCSLIPTIGTALVWAPASLMLMVAGYFSGDAGMMWSGLGLFLYGLLIISTIDNFLLAKLVHAKADVNQIVVIIGVIGGAAMFGIVGIFIGPILLPLLITYFEAFKERFT